jgi:GNAT superfamily N-acetyltransferase
MNLDSYIVRRFEPEDGEVLFSIRAHAFVREFCGELSRKTVAAGIKAYMPSDYVRIGHTVCTFVAVEDQDPIGFVTVRLVSRATSEILLLYVNLDRTGRGVGSELVRVAEEWVRKEHPHVSQMVVDTVVPRYNKSFYERLGYHAVGHSEVRFPDGPVAAIRLCKDLKKTDTA